MFNAKKLSRSPFQEVLTATTRQHCSHSKQIGSAPRAGAEARDFGSRAKDSCFDKEGIVPTGDFRLNILPLRIGLADVVGFSVLTFTVPRNIELRLHYKLSFSPFEPLLSKIVPSHRKHAV